MGNIIVKDLLTISSSSSCFQKIKSSSKPSLLHETPQDLSSPITKLSEDILFNIFLRLGHSSILKCKGISKVWHSVISNPVFINTWLAKYASIDNFVAWLVVYNTHRLKDETLFTEKNSITNTTPYHTRFVYSQDGINLEFLYGSITFKENQFRLGSSYGLFLCQPTKSSDSVLAVNRFWSQIFGNAFSENSWGYNHPELRHYQETYCVLNPLTSKEIEIPRPSDKWIAGHCMYSGPSTVHASLCSTMVVRIPQIWTPSEEFDLEVYSSDTGEWEVRRVSCPPGTTITIKTLTSLDVVAHNGVLYWINGEKSVEIRTIDLRNDKGDDGFHQCKAFYLPVEYERDGCLGAQLEGNLRYCSVSNHMLNLWELRLVENSNEDKWDWHLVHKDVDISNIRNYSNYKPAALNPLDCDIVLLRSCNRWTHFLEYNIRTRRITELKDSFQS